MAGKRAVAYKQEFGFGLSCLMRETLNKTFTLTPYRYTLMKLIRTIVSKVNNGKNNNKWFKIFLLPSFSMSSYCVQLQKRSISEGNIFDIATKKCLS